MMCWAITLGVSDILCHSRTIRITGNKRGPAPPIAIKPSGNAIWSGFNQKKWVMPVQSLNQALSQ